MSVPAPVEIPVLEGQTTIEEVLPPRRVQRRRVKGWTMPPNTVYVGRGSKWGNPWIIDPERATYPPRNQYRATLGECLDLYRDYAAQMSDLARELLAGKNLACWCGVKAPCHADVLLEIANGGDDAVHEASVQH